MMLRNAIIGAKISFTTTLRFFLSSSLAFYDEHRTTDKYLPTHVSTRDEDLGGENTELPHYKTCYYPVTESFPGNEFYMS